VRNRLKDVAVGPLDAARLDVGQHIRGDLDHWHGCWKRGHLSALLALILTDGAIA
jgi:hypothetical protein